LDLSALRARHPAIPYVVPFLVFVVLLAVQGYNPLPQNIEFPLRLVILAIVLWICSRDVIELRAQHLIASASLGIVVFVIWVLPDAIYPPYRQFWIFQNPLTGTLQSSLTRQAQTDPFVLACRAIRAVFLVPVIEELFWRGWLMRWLISPRFDGVRLGTYNMRAFWITALLFATEHGPYWDVGLIAGVAYNWWMVRTRSLGDCILAHAVTNACLCGYVLATHRWEYWL
jgi:CAAX prenyl protease-like protein